LGQSINAQVSIQKLTLHVSVGEQSELFLQDFFIMTQLPFEQEYPGEQRII
jgi:hypothetical protein